MSVADTLSRAPLRDELDLSELERSLEVVQMVDNILLSDPALEKIRENTETDSTLQLEIDLVQNGWPSSQSNIPSGAEPYFHFRDKLVEEHVIFFKSSRCVIPAAMR